MPRDDRPRLWLSSRFDPDRDYGPEQAAILDEAGVAAARREMAAWPGYAPTPLLELPTLASSLGVAELWCKDEGGRFGLGSFKALGGAYAVFRHLCDGVADRTGRAPSSDDLLNGRHRAVTEAITVTTATAGNHGRSVAWGAQLFGCRCVVYMHEKVPDSRVLAVERLGAEVVRVAGNYDDSVRRCAEDAIRFGRQVIADTAYEGYREIPCQVMQGYGVLAQEILAQLSRAAMPTHLFIQAGCGGFAAAVYGRLWESWGSARPRLIVVEALNADCLYRSACAGALTAVPGALQTIMGGLSCGEVSQVAWPILESGAFAFMAIDDGWAMDAMRRLDAGTGGDPVIVAGEAGAGGVAGLLAATADADTRHALGLDGSARVLTIVSETATDPDSYRRIVGHPPNAAAAATR